jgi:hypothetical protein
MITIVQHFLRRHAPTIWLTLSMVAFASYTTLWALPPINLFRPSDRFILPEIWPCTPFEFTVAYEGSIKVRGFQDDDDECRQVSTDCSVDGEKKVNVLHIYQDKQNALAAFKGFESTTSLGQLSQLFNINDENGGRGTFKPTARFKVPLNLMFIAQYNYKYGLSFGLYLPVYSMELSRVRWYECANATTLENRLEHDLIKLIKDTADLDITGWKRTGIGDLVAMVLWTGNFPQIEKFLLTNVRVNARLGLNFPTGKRQDEDKILAIPFGSDGSWGIQMAGGLDLFFCSFLRGGLDAEFLYLFGNTRCRRLKVDCNQTDLLFLTKLPAFREFGLSQQFNLYLEAFNFCKGLTFKVNYQFLKRNEDKLFVCNDRIDPFIVNSAESLQDWTAHSFILSAGYDYGYQCPTSRFIPAIKGWVKWGFNGKRALLANTLGVELTVSF